MNRIFNQNIYKKIHDGYSNFIKTEQNLNSIIIDISDIDFVENKKDYTYILNKIQKF
jgi:deoxyadenosine/deoxycytidine kinase